MELKKKTILIVDDEEDLTWSISRNVQKNAPFFEVDCAQAANDALWMLERKSYDLVISDLRMPGMNGLELIREIRNRWPDTKTIMMTAYGADELSNRKSISGIPYIGKPFELSVLREMIYDTLDITLKTIEGFNQYSRIREIIEYNCQTRRTSQLSFKNGHERGIVCVRKGEIVHAECGELEGESALLNILDWDHADSIINLERYSIKQTICRGWQCLLNDVMVD